MAGIPSVVATAFAVIAVPVVAVGCGDADDPTTDEGREATVYALVLEWLVDQEPTPADGDLVLYITPRSEHTVDIDVQANVVELMAPSADVRFIDELAEALELDEPGAPVRGDGVLVGFGAVASEGDVVEVYVDRYRTADDVEAWTVTARRTGTSWRFVQPPEPIEPRPAPEPD